MYSSRFSVVPLSLCRNTTLLVHASIPTRLSSTVDLNRELNEKVKKSIEEKWRDKIKPAYYNRNDIEKPKSYILSMFPYPSGNLHMGHVRVYTISDTIARYHRMLGKNVFHPMGFDAFGLPAENAARDRKISAEKWTWSNIKTMREQLKQLELSFDWDSEVITCSPNYYKFTQHIFLLMYKAGLVYQKEALVNWDPVDQTVLADEQVDSQGRSWRSGALIEKKFLKQWFIRTTWFANALRKGLDREDLADWRDIVKLQKHWIGECNGSSFEFPLMQNGKSLSSVTLWTRFPEGIRGAAFVAASPRSGLARQINLWGKVSALNPFTKKTLPVVVTDRVQFDEGCDTKLGLPFAFESDRKFAVENNIAFIETEFVKDAEARDKICQLGRDAGIGGYPTSSKLHDWLISRQRHWGTPIPMIHCDSCGPTPVPFEQLPVLLPEPEKIVEWSKAHCPKCSKPGRREVDTMDTFVDSSWYFLRYTDPHNTDEPFTKDSLSRLMPVDIYVGGKEHAVLHLYYARFVSYFLHSLGYLEDPEPFRRLLVQGIVMGKTYQVVSSGKFIPKDEVDFSGDSPVVRGTNEAVVESWDKMSKSKYNGVEPIDILNKYGHDTTRLFILSDVAPTSNKHWSEDTFPNIFKWQNRIWHVMRAFYKSRVKRTPHPDPQALSKMDAFLWDARNWYVKQTTFCYTASYQLSVAISKLQGFSNCLKKPSIDVIAHSVEYEKALAAFIIMLSPMSPSFSSELWSWLQKAPNRLSSDFIRWEESVTDQDWPVLDSNYELEVIFKVGNAVKNTIKLPYSEFRNLSREEAVRLGLADRKVQDFISGRDILDLEFGVIENYNATVNFTIDHLQKRKTSAEGGG